MQFIVSSSALLKSLNTVSGVIGTNTVLPILEDFLFEIEDNNLSITGSDLETRIQVSMPIQTAEGTTDSTAKICVTSKIILEYLKNLPDQPLSFSINADSNTVELTSNSGKYKVQGQSSNEYPKAPEVNDATNFSITSMQLIESITSTIFATSNDTLRPAMTGVLFDFQEDGTTFVATDAHRLIKHVRTDVKAPSSDMIIVPKKPLLQLKGILKSDDSSVNISYNSTHIYVQQDNVTLSSRLIDAKYPPYNAVIPTENPYSLTINRSQLISALKRVSVFASKGTAQVVFEINGNSIAISAQDDDFSYEGNEQLDCQYNGEDMKIAFNGKLLIELLSNLSSDNVVLKLSTPSKAGIFKNEEDPANEDLLMLLMPLLANL